MNKNQTEKIRNHLWELVAKLKMIQGPSRELNRLVEEKVRVLRHMAPNEWLRENEVVERYPVFTVKWLQAARCRGYGPVYHKMGTHRNARIIYKCSDIEAYLESHRVPKESLSDKGNPRM